MNETRGAQLGSGLANRIGRRESVSSLGILGMALLATLGSPDESIAKKKGKNKRRSAGPQDAQGPAGPAGPAGSSPAVSIVRGPAVDFSVPSGGFTDRSSHCPGTSLAISRRIHIDNPRCGIIEDSFIVSGDGWNLSLSCPPGESSNLNVVEVICLA